MQDTFAHGDSQIKMGDPIFHNRSYDNKWLRYYPDFFRKYHAALSLRESVPLLGIL